MGKCIIRKIPTGRGNIYGLEERKKALRQEIKAAAVALDEGYTKEADLEIFSHVAGLSEYEQAGTLFCFVGTSGEIDTAPILEDALRKGKRVGVPKCTARGIMEVREIRSLGDLEAGKYGILEPGAETPVIQPEEINLAIVPCMSCSHEIGRASCRERVSSPV